MMEIGHSVGRQPHKNIATNSDALNNSADIVNTLRRIKFDQNFIVSYQTGAGMTVGLKPQSTNSSMGYPYGNNWTCGYVINAAVAPATLGTVSIWNAKARRYGEYNTDGTNKTWVTPTAETVVTFTGNGPNQKIIWQWDPSGGLVILTTPQVNDPSDAPPIIYGIVAQFDVTNGVPKLSIAEGCSDQLGHLLILPMFAPAST